MRRNNTTFVKRCNKILSNSLITGIPKIVNTKNSRRKAFKLLAFFISIVGFLWQTYTFLEIYRLYPVVQHITIEEPEEFNAPAVTLCNLNRIERQRLCDIMPSLCTDLNAVFSMDVTGMYCLDNTYKRFCPVKMEKNYSIKLPIYDLEEQSALNNQSNEFLQLLGPQSQKDLLEKCTIERNAQSITCNDSIMIQVSDDGVPYKCFTFFSSLGEPNKNLENLSLSDSYYFRLNLHPEEYMTVYDMVGVSVSVHDPRRLKNPLSEFKILESGGSFRLYVTMEHRQYLAPPYETKCVDYIDLWKKKGGRGPLSKDDCMQNCMIDAMTDQHGCVNKAIFYPNNFPLCPRKKSNYVSEELVAKCESSCKEGCEVTEYSITSEYIEDIRYKLCNETDGHCKLSYLDIEFNFNRLTVERLKSEPMFTSEELFSHIGGYMGLWLGTSFIALFDLAEMLLDIIVHPVLKWRKMKTKIVHGLDYKRNE